mgnify:CR=1 FL=1
METYWRLSMNNKVIIVSGATATGKTNLAIDIALLMKEKNIDAEIVNFDSILFYQELKIGSAMPTEKEKKGIPHHLISIESIKNNLTAACFKEKAEDVIKTLWKEKKSVILVGGSGFYLQSLIKGMPENAGRQVPTDIRQKSDDLYREKGIDAFLEILREKDEKSVEQIHFNDHYRLRRAVEYFWQTSLPFSKIKEEWRRDGEQKNPFFSTTEFHHIHLKIEKKNHFDIIQQRTHKMIEDGLIEEVQDLLQQGFSRENARPLSSVGYKEVLDFLEGKISHIHLEERINIATRQLAKAQRTWFNRVDTMKSFDILKERDFLLEDLMKKIS